MAFKLNLSGAKSVEDLDRESHVEPGWYRAKVEDATQNDKTGAEVIVCQVMGGRFDGCKADIQLQDPEQVTDVKKAERAISRIQVIATRLGLVSKEMLGNDDVDINFNDAIGKEVVIECEAREYTKDNGTKSSFTGIAYTGIYPLDHEKIPDQVRKDLGLPPARKSTKSQSGGFSPATKGSGRTTKATAGKSGGATKEVSLDEV